MVLWGLLALPVIWWLLRLTPPKPQTEVFPPLKILARVLKREETPHQSPWWLTLLRLLMAALVVTALAEPVFNPREKLPAEGSALALVIDNDWASAADWGKRVATAQRLIADASSNGVPVVIAFTAEKPNAEIGPFDAATALDRLRAAKPRPDPDRPPGHLCACRRGPGAPAGRQCRRARGWTGGARRRSRLQHAAVEERGAPRLGNVRQAVADRPHGRR